MIGYKLISGFMTKKDDFTSLKTVTFGDESAVISNRAASIISIVAIFLIWGSFTGSKVVPSFLHVSGPYVGETSFTYEAKDASGATDTGTIKAVVHPVSQPAEKPVVDEAANTGFAKDAAEKVITYRSILVSKSDLLENASEQEIVSVDGKAIAPNGSVQIDTGQVRMTDKGSIAFEPNKGLQMESIWLPAPETVVTRLFELASNGYQNVTLGRISIRRFIAFSSVFSSALLSAFRWATRWV